MPRTAYKHLFFDLDHTLWDFERNTNETLVELFEAFDLHKRGIPTAQAFQETFHKVNAELWHLHDSRQISQEELRYRRFRQVINQLGCEEDNSCDEWSEWYLSRCPYKPHLLPGALELLDYLAPRYEMHIITNGFGDVQYTKMDNSGLTGYFKEVVTSKTANAKKPEPAMFHFAMEKAGCIAGDALMIGDNPEADVAGALGVGMHAAYFRPEQSLYPPCEATYQLRSLLELKQWL
ncbi:YjjG family noncanonical pyrimidine nucleotidase [Siphonobacter sp. SORGH_AS_1065]|uniref:YjjG family noncanonical pyrimidine nucleotidase n=1 Tax=Siphonobacter sp. SORGH_AS_1065 TaxID=3041795 RepID=UPI002781555A|nr:YjjG family noncanonical pyrimidine nucleotidase [Siphonobacter sp. SORGH_AS_1065]MDQ1086951.1 YjjG family noncanonical pyrimidine nucleotidase [Siphonobacter sp. SORGH_AS_1065]